MPETVADDEEENVLRKLKPKILDHNDTHHVAENMKIRKDARLRLWRQSDPYAVRRRMLWTTGFTPRNNKIFMRQRCLTRSPLCVT